ncbi:hypothetical protein ACKFKF_14900 [Phormidesmis sp. 146-12]
MQLSPFAQYYIRKLLRQNIDRANPLLANETEDRLLSELDINQTLTDLYLEDHKIAAKKWELETLTQISQNLEKSHYEQESLIEIKRRILDILGFRSAAIVPSKLPLIVQEKLVPSFRFYREGKVLEGINFRHEFYGLVKEFETTQRLRTYQLAWALSEKNIPMILTTADARLGIWIRLRSPAYSAWLDQAAILPNLVLLLHSALHRFKQVFTRPTNSIDRTNH